MGLEYAVLLHCLKKRLDYCYDEYIERLLGLDAEQLIELASEIVAIKETYYEMGFWLDLSICKDAWPNVLIDGPIKEQDVSALLALENPLIELGLKWWFYTFGKKVGFHGFYKACKE